MAAAALAIRAVIAATSVAAAAARCAGRMGPGMALPAATGQLCGGGSRRGAASDCGSSNSSSDEHPRSPLMPTSQVGAAVRPAGGAPQAAGDDGSHLQHLSSATPLVVGRFARTRAGLDHAWHPRYGAERQLLQDEIVLHFLGGGCSCARPWMVFTAGAMGAGKSWTMRHLQAAGAFPLRRFVVVDADKIRRCLPEMPHYLLHHRAHAGSLTQREAGYLAEIITREAMVRQKNIVVDGSLRDADWYAHVFRRVRTDFAAYRIAVLLVSAPREVVVQRATRRGAITGREIPPDVLDDALVRVPRSFARLAPLADYAAVIHNGADGVLPTFEPPASLPHFASLWTHLCDDPAHRHQGDPATPVIPTAPAAADDDDEDWAPAVPHVRRRLAHRTRARLAATHPSDVHLFGSHYTAPPPSSPPPPSVPPSPSSSHHHGDGYDDDCGDEE